MFEAMLWEALVIYEQDFQAKIGSGNVLATSNAPISLIGTLTCLEMESCSCHHK
jgi:hypothetical protein